MMLWHFHRYILLYRLVDRALCVAFALMPDNEFSVYPNPERDLKKLALQCCSIRPPFSTVELFRVNAFMNLRIWMQIMRLFAQRKNCTTFTVLGSVRLLQFSELKSWLFHFCPRWFLLEAKKARNEIGTLYFCKAGQNDFWTVVSTFVKNKKPADFSKNAHFRHV